MFQLLLKDKVRGKGSLFNFARKLFFTEPPACVANRGFFVFGCGEIFAKKRPEKTFLVMDVNAVSPRFDWFCRL